MRTKVPANKRQRVDAVAPVDADAVPSPVDAPVAPVDAVPSPVDADAVPSPVDADAVPSPVDASVAPVDADAVPSPVDASVAPVDASVPATELTNDAKWLRLHRDFPNRVLGLRALIFFLGMIGLHASLTEKNRTPRLQLVVDNINMQMESPSNHLGILSELLDSPYLATVKMLRAIPALHALFAALDATKDVRSDEVAIEWDRLKMPVHWALYQAIFRETRLVHPHCGGARMTV